MDQLTAAALRNELLPIGAETILSPRIVDNDPLVTRYVIQTGDSLAKIAAMYKVSPELLASVNGMADKNLIRAGQTIKVVKGPFRAVVRKQEFVLEVYLGDTFVRHFRVGLGAADSTPTGDWEVGTKLINPTYYPPRGGESSPPTTPPTRWASDGSDCSASRDPPSDSSATASTEPANPIRSVRTPRWAASDWSTTTSSWSMRISSKSIRPLP